MINTMRHLELHLINNAEDQRVAQEIGLDVFDEETCQNCLQSVGDSRGNKFVPFALVLDDQEEWIVCSDCASPVL